MQVYNLFPLLCGPVTHWEPHLERASAMGFDWVYVNAFHKPGESGSIYAVKEHFQFSSLLIDRSDPRTADAQFKDTFQRARELGLNVMADLVAGFCAVDSPLVTQHPEWFCRDSDGEVYKPVLDTPDGPVILEGLARFDHEETTDPEGLFGFFQKWIHFLLDLGVRGFRCAAAHLVPTRAWERLIWETRRMRGEVVFVAETLGRPLPETLKTADAGFDYVFNSFRWWDLTSEWFVEQQSLSREVVRSIGFPESHDTVRLAEEIQGNVAGMKQRYLLASLLSEGTMIPVGYEFGFRGALDTVQTRPAHWEDPTMDLTGFIARVNECKKQYAVFRKESPFAVLRSPNPQVLLIWKGSAGLREEALIIVNKSIWDEQEIVLDHLPGLTQSGGVLEDVSPEEPMEFLPSPFHYRLRPGEGRVFWTGWTAGNGKGEPA